MEIRREQVIDLAVSDDGKSATSSDESVSDEDIMDMGDETARSSTPSLTNSEPTSAQSSPPQGERHSGKALLTPLPTVLKADRLGVGLKARDRRTVQSLTKTGYP